jgi:hypothetical protein
VHWAMTRILHHHNCHMDCLRRVPLLSWIILCDTCTTFSHMDHTWEVVEAVEDLDQIVIDMDQVVTVSGSGCYNFLQTIELVIVK